MRRNVSRRKLNTIFLFVIAGLYSFISVGYAALSQNLMISGDVSYLYHSRRLYDVLKRAAEDGTYATEYTGAHQDSMAGVGSKKIYHWYGSNNANGTAIQDKFNVIFAGHCWQMIRTTDTGGVKMIYNGEAENNQCLNTRGNHVGYASRTTQTLDTTYYYGTSYTYDKTNNVFSLDGTVTTGNINLGEYTCKSTAQDGTCATIYFVDKLSSDSSYYVIPLNGNSPYSQFGGLQFSHNQGDDSPADAGYMYRTRYVRAMKTLSSVEDMLYDSTVNTAHWYAHNITWGNPVIDRYNLDNPYQISSVDDYPNLVGEYTFRNTSQTHTNTSVYYITAVDDTTMYYIQLRNESGSTHDLSYYNYTYTYGDSFTDNGNGTYTINNATTINRSDWYTNYNNVGANKYVCKNAVNDTCSDLWYTTATYATNMHYIEVVNNYKYANGFTYDEATETYTLNNDSVSFWNIVDSSNITSLNNNHYTCWNVTGECEAISYIISVDTTTLDYVDIRNGKSVEDILNEMLFDNSVNQINSVVKTGIDAWYKHYLLNYNSYIEDTIFCNDRSIVNLGRWNPDGGGVTSDDNNNLHFKNFVENNDLSCTNLTDKFSVSNSSAQLIYPVGLMTSSEMNILNNNNVRKTGQDYWTMSPRYFRTSYFYTRVVRSSGGMGSDMLYFPKGIRPAISLIPGIKYSSGTGSMADPYIINDYISNTSFSDGAISNGTRDVTITFPSGCGNGLTCSYTKDNGSSVNVTSSSVVVNFTSPGTLSTIVSDDTTTLNNSHLVRFDALYVSSSGNDTTGNGSISAPYKTLTKAYDMAEDTSTIYVMNNLTVTATTTFDRYKNITLTSCTKSGDTCPTSSANSIIRGSSFTDYILNNNRGTLDLNTIKVDGNSVSADHSLIVNRTTLNVNSGATLQGADNSGNGGAVYNYGEVTLNGGTITSNNAGTGAGIYNDAGEVEIVSGTISGNASTASGGGIWSSGVVTMSGGSLVRNTAQTSGGGIFGNTTSSIVMTGGTIGGSSANKNSAGENGGGIGTNGTVNLSGNSTVISYNESDVRGGGILVSSLNPSPLTSTINGITVNNNTSVTGGGIYLYGTDAVLNITNTTINNNTVTNRGGGVYGYIGTTLNISGGTISNNSATDGGGIGTVATLNVSNSASITKNTASEHGGAIFGNVDSVITVSSATIGGSAANKNTAVSGGGIFYNGSLTVSGSTSTTKITYNEAEAGGGIANTTSTYESTSSLTVSGGTISYNKSTVQSGGGIYAYGTVQITGGTISNNTSATYGGGFVCKTNCTMSGGTISSNSSTSDGGGVRTDGTFTLSGGSVQSNTATSNAFYNNFSIRTTNGANLYDSSASFTANHTKYYIASAVNNNYVIDLTDGAVHGNVQLLQKASNNTHKWKMLPGKAVSGVVYYYIQNQSQTTQCASVSGSSSSTGANILGWEVGDVSGRYFSLEKIGSYYYIKNISGTCVSKGGGSSAANGNNILTATCANSNINKWKFVAA